MTIRQKVFVWVIVQAIKRKRFFWLASRMVKVFALRLSIDRENKKWRVSSKPMWAPAYQSRTYDDILSIFKSDWRTFETEETRDENGRLLKFVVTT